MTTLENIKRIIATYGSFSVADLKGNTSPVINIFGKDSFELAEKFYDKGVDSVSYIHETVVDENFLEWENINDDIIAEIEILAENYEADCLQTEKRSQS